VASGSYLTKLVYFCIVMYGSSECLLCRFEWPVARSDVENRSIELMVKNSTGVFSKDRVNMGQLRLDLSQFDDVTKASTEWYDAYSWLL